MHRDFIQLKLTFVPKKRKVRFLSHPLGDLEVTYALELFFAKTLQAGICRRERFLKGVGHFDHPLKAEGDVAHQRLLGSKKLKGLPFHVV